MSQAHHPGLPQAARYPPNHYPEVEVFPHLACIFTALCGLSRSSRKVLVALYSWSEGRSASKGWIRATVSVTDADEQMSGVSPCGVSGTWLRKELVRNGGLLGWELVLGSD